MWRLEPDSPAPWGESAFAETLGAHRDFFDAGAPLFVARAPGRLDLMGGIADYSGSLVLQLPLAAATFAAAQTRAEREIRVRSIAPGATGGYRDVSVSLDELAPGGRWLDDASAHGLLMANPRRAWGGYVIGTLVALARTAGIAPALGVRVLVESTVPAGKGVSSSAALEVASLRALAAAYADATGAAAEPADGRSIALLCQRVENAIVGAPCGVMDQMTSACGETDTLLALRCQPAELEAPVRLPSDLAVWGIDSGVRHEVAARSAHRADYRSVRTGAFMGYRMLAALAGLPARPLAPGRVAVDDGRWRGYLANVTPHEWAGFASQIPEETGGEEFLATYGGITDAVTSVDPGRRYRVRAPTAHPVHESHRVERFRLLLTAERGGTTPDDVAIALGALMVQSHESYGTCGLGSAGTDRLVALVQDAGPPFGLFGAKITGGGSGGTVAVLGRPEAERTVRAIADAYGRETGRATRVLQGSSPGAIAYGTRRGVWAPR